MDAAPKGRVTQLLQRSSDGDAQASSELIPIVYEELHRIARLRLRGERPGHTLQPTALVNEAWLRLFGPNNPAFNDRAHFLAAASRAMRRILVDHARARNSAKRDRDVAIPAEFQIEIGVRDANQLVNLLDLDRSLDDLAASWPNASEAIEMRYFGGMTAEETAVSTGRSVHIVQHDIRFGHAWLRRNRFLKTSSQGDPIKLNDPL